MIQAIQSTCATRFSCVNCLVYSIKKTLSALVVLRIFNGTMSEKQQPVAVKGTETLPTGAPAGSYLP